MLRFGVLEVEADSAEKFSSSREAQSILIGYVDSFGDFMWIPAWLWQGYSRLYSTFEVETFSLSEAMQVLSLDDLRTRVILSRLRRAGYIVMFERSGRTRRYRILEPSLLSFAEGASIRNFLVPQGRYVQLILLWCRRLFSHYEERLRTIVLYGSTARGSALPSSDLDFLLIADRLDKSYGRRIEEIVSLELDPPVEREKTYLYQHGYSSQLSNIVYTPEESRNLRLIYLDIIHDGRILFDSHNHFGEIIAALKARLDKTRTKRVVLEDGGWYWDLNPDMRFGDRLKL